MKLSAVAQLYVVRLKTKAALGQEALALLGIAVGVALLFASQVASSSLNGSVRQLTNGIVGHSQFQLKARDLQGFDARLLGQVARLPGVQGTVPVLEHPVSLIGSSGRKVAVDLLADRSARSASRWAAAASLHAPTARRPAGARAAGRGRARDRRRAAGTDQGAGRRAHRAEPDRRRACRHRSWEHWRTVRWRSRRSPTRSGSPACGTG